MNHYERLKVNPEAPPEVIRAAYRALAAKLHPDRKGGDAGPNEHAHEEMAALNASYLVLMDEKARADYDRTLKGKVHAAPESDAPGRGAGRTAWGGRARAASTEPEPELESVMAGQNGADTRIDIDWLMAMPAAPQVWYKNPRWVSAAVVAGGLVLSGLVWWGVHEAERLEFDRSLAQRGAVEPAAQVPQAAAPVVPVAPQAAASGASMPELSAEQLSKMSDEELLAAMPKLLNDNVSTTASHPTLMAPSGPAHPLDGQPLGLKLAPMTLPSLKINQP